VLLNRVWFSGSCVLYRVYNFTSRRLEQDFFLSGLEALNATCGHSITSFIKKKMLSVWELKNKVDKKRRTKAKYKGHLS